MRFGSIDAKGTEHTEEDFGVIHNAMEVFGARASCVEDYIIGGMAFLGFILRNKTVPLSRTPIPNFSVRGLALFRRFSSLCPSPFHLFHAGYFQVFLLKPLRFESLSVLGEF